MAIAAGNAWVVGYDNLSGLSDSLSDALCRLSTGMGFGTRELYSNDDEKLFDASRPIMLNGIEELGTRGDLLDRAVAVNLLRIDESKRRDEAEVWGEFERDRPQGPGGTAGRGLRCTAEPAGGEARQPSPVADFAKWVKAAEPALGWPEGAFMEAYGTSRNSAAALAIEASAIGPAVLSLVNSVPGWDGTSAELLNTLGDPHSTEAIRHRKGLTHLGTGVSGALHALPRHCGSRGWRWSLGSGPTPARPSTWNGQQNDRHNRHNLHPSPLAGPRKWVRHAGGGGR